MITFIMSLCSLQMLGALPQAQELSYSQLLSQTYDLRHLCELPAADERSEQLRLVVEAGQLEYEITGPAVVTRLFIDAVAGKINLDFAEDSFVMDLSDTSKLATAPLVVDYGNATSMTLPLTIAANATLRVSASAASYVELDVWYPGSAYSLPDSSNKFLRTQRDRIKRTIEVFVNNQHPVTMLSPNPQKIGATYYRSKDLPPSTTNGEFRWLLRGSGIVRWFELDFVHKVAPAETVELLRSLVLKIEHGCESIDDEGTTVAEIPLGDFFSAYRDASANNNYFLGYNEQSQRFYCRLPITFKKNLRLSIASDIPGMSRLRMVAGVDMMDPKTVPALTLRSNFVRAVGSSSAESAQLDVKGAARLIASMFSFTSPSSSQVIQDQDFGFASASHLPDLTHGEQILRREGPGVFGNNSFMRWYLSAAPSSETELSYNPALKLADDKKTNYCLSTWWFGSLDAKVAGAVTYPQAQRLHADNPLPTFFVVDGANEAEHIAKPRMSTGSTIEVVLVDSSREVSSLQFTKWMPSAPMQAILFDYSIAESGKYSFEVQLMTGPGFGKVQVLIDGKATGEIIDCNSDDVGTSGLIAVGAVRMMARNSHVLGFRSVDEKAIGIDCYIIKKL
ncbi:DUF2961 domain-containing protein [Planctomycetota bacterium]|nr:DUF2961 domain-containing protein [Planctomycetota bacterium]